MGLVDYFTYDGVASSDFGFYASGEATFDTPEKEYDVFEIPGRNGDMEIFNGRFKNITVTYPCIYQMRGSDFATDFANFRAALLSRNGYKRLYDTHHPEEYRMAIVKNVIAVNPTEHDLVTVVNVEFDCKPQRFLVSGEAPVTVTSGDAITNPTLYESHPLLLVDGYGAITVNGSEISVSDEPVGDICLASATTGSSSSLTVEVDSNLFNSGDTITVNSGLYGMFGFTIQSSSSTSTISAVSISASSSGIGLTGALNIYGTTGKTVKFVFNDSPELTFEALTASSYTDVFDYTITMADSTVFTGTVTFTLEHTADATFVFSYTYTCDATVIRSNTRLIIPEIDVYSTEGSLGEPLYLDLENGEAYKYESDSYVSINSAVWLGTELPVLDAGVNEITFDDTVTELQIVPRWWTI